MTKAETLRDLIARLEAGTEWDPALDEDIHVALLRTKPETNIVWLGRLTASIDASLALVERVLPGCAFRIQRTLDSKIWVADLRRRSGAFRFDVWAECNRAPDARRAILIALFRALVAKEEAHARPL